MNFEEFQHFARLYVVGALDAEEAALFEAARRAFGSRAEDFVRECRKLNAAFALSLHPRPPRENARKKLMSLIQGSSRTPQVTA
jgi:hypothetical protein